MEKISLQVALQHLGGKKSVKVYVPTRGTGTIPLEGIAQPVTTSVIKVLFPPDALPTNVDPRGEFKLAIFVAGPTIAVHGRIRQIVNDRQLLLELREAYEHPQKREHFRIDVDLPVRYWRHEDGVEEPAEIFVSPSERINLSAGGMMLVVELAVELEDLLGVELRLPGPPREIVRAVAKVVRVVERGANRWAVGLCFIDLEKEARETLVSFCFAEQRRQLRTKVQVAGPR